LKISFYYVMNILSRWLKLSFISNCFNIFIYLFSIQCTNFLFHYWSHKFYIIFKMSIFHSWLKLTNNISICSLFMIIRTKILFYLRFCCIWHLFLSLICCMRPLWTLIVFLRVYSFSFAWLWLRSYIIVSSVLFIDLFSISDLCYMF
jgi:hypothetical protein